MSSLQETMVINLAEYYDRKYPVQHPPEQISRELRQKFSASPSLHAAINRFVPILEEYALKDKSRASRYRSLAQRLRKVSEDIKGLIKEYE